MQNACQSCLSDYQNQLNQFDMSEADGSAGGGGDGGGGGIQIPQRFRDSVQSLQEQFQTLSARGKQRSNQIAQMVASWEEFDGRLEELTRWVRSQEMELVELRQLESFAMEFSSHRTRLQVSWDSPQ